MPRTSYSDLNPNSTLHSDDGLPILHVSFNDTGDCFAVVNGRGFRVYTCKGQLSLASKRDFDYGFDAVEMLLHSNMIALISCRRRVIIWDDRQMAIIGDRTFPSEVLSVKLRLDFIFVVLKERVLVHNSKDFELAHQIETISNPKGLCEVLNSTGSRLLACPGLQMGQVRVELIRRTSNIEKFIAAHPSEIESLALSKGGILLATASSTDGRFFVRIFNVLDGNKLHEVSVDANEAQIYRISFSPSTQWLAVSTNKGAVYVFKLNLGIVGVENLSSTELGFELSRLTLTGRSLYLSSYLLTQFLGEGTQHAVAFCDEEAIVRIAGLDGRYYKCMFDPLTCGEITILESHNFPALEYSTS